MSEPVQTIPASLLRFDSLEAEAMVELLAATPELRHFVDSGHARSGWYRGLIEAAIPAGGAWGIDRFLAPGTATESVRLVDYKRKNPTTMALLEKLKSVRGFSGLPGVAWAIADEMIMNAMFDAPRDSSGKEKYNHLPRTHHLILEPGEAVTLRYGADADVLAISIEDPFGALDHATLIRYLKTCYARDGELVSRKPGGAGRGLFTIFANSHCLIVNREPGARTEMIALIFLTRKSHAYASVRKSLSFFEA